MNKQKLIFLIFFAFIFILSFKVVEDIDLGWHIRVGEYIAQSKTIPSHDLFTFSQPHYPYIYHSWASELFLFESYNLLGLLGVSFLYAVVLTLVMLIIYKTSKTISGKNPSYLLFSISTLVTYIVAGGRTRIFSLLFLVTVYYCLIKFYNSGSKIIWTIPAIFLLWVNFHGSFPLGIGLLAITAFTYYQSSKKTKNDKYKLRELAAITVLSVVGTFINPYSLKSWQNAFEVSLNSYTKISAINPDWQSLLASNTSSWILVALSAGIISLAYFLKQKKARVHLFLSLLFLTLSLFTSRFSIGLIVVVIPLANLSLIESQKRLNATIIT